VDALGRPRRSVLPLGVIRAIPITKAMITTYTDQQKRIIEELKPLGIGGWHATHGLAQDFKCAYCDTDYLASYDAYYSLTFDHIIPDCSGGEHSEENTVACCRACNFLKHICSPSGNNREERIADARQYIKEKRLLREAEVARIRLLVRGDSHSTQP
jgi:5-methylcytosine-specific restriction endonuclease McrA